MVSGLRTSPYDQDMIVCGEARLIRSAINPLVSTGTLLKIECDLIGLCIACSRLISETNKGKRSEVFPQALAKLDSVFYTSNDQDYMPAGAARQEEKASSTGLWG